MFDMMKMLGKMKEVQAKVKEAQEKIGTMTTEAESGGGLVKAVVNGNRQIIRLEIDDSLWGEEDKDILQDLIVAAVNKAIENADLMAKEEMKKQTQGMLPDIPGLDLSNLS